LQELQLTYALVAAMH